MAQRRSIYHVIYHVMKQFNWDVKTLTYTILTFQKLYSTTSNINATKTKTCTFSQTCLKQARNT